MVTFYCCMSMVLYIYIIFVSYTDSHQYVHIHYNVEFEPAPKALGRGSALTELNGSSCSGAHKATCPGHGSANDYHNNLKKWTKAGDPGQHQYRFSQFLASALSLN